MMPIGERWDGHPLRPAGIGPPRRGAAEEQHATFVARHKQFVRQQRPISKESQSCLSTRPKGLPDVLPGNCNTSRTLHSGYFASIIHRGGAEDVLADALDVEPLDFSRLRQAGDLRAKPGERGVGEADA
jgi:hypothetical protein